jgi:hypothetical protein
MDIGIEPSTGDVLPRSRPTAHNQQSTFFAWILTLRYVWECRRRKQVCCGSSSAQEYAPCYWAEVDSTGHCQTLETPWHIHHASCTGRHPIQKRVCTRTTRTPTHRQTVSNARRGETYQVTTAAAAAALMLWYTAYTVQGFPQVMQVAEVCHRDQASLPALVLYNAGCTTHEMAATGADHLELRTKYEVESHMLLLMAPSHFRMHSKAGKQHTCYISKALHHEFLPEAGPPWHRAELDERKRFKLPESSPARSTCMA